VPSGRDAAGDPGWESTRKAMFPVSLLNLPSTVTRSRTLVERAAVASESIREFTSSSRELSARLTLPGLEFE